MGFYEMGTGKEILNIKTLSLLNKCIGVSGMSFLDNFLGFHISTTTKGVIKMMKRRVNKDVTYWKNAFNEVKNLTAFSE